MTTSGSSEIPSEYGDSSTMTAVGWLLAISGLILAFYAFFIYDPSVDAFNAEDYASFGRRIINNGLLQRQLMIFLFGLTVFSAGVIAICTAKVRSALAAMR